jgi:GR25 family glycosyltransferase involved in LPS biosynthesis
MKHVDVWHEIVEHKISLALILEDDPIFVPFFKEKFNRFIYTAIRTGALRLNQTCLNQTNNSISDQEWFNQEPMFVIGICFDFMDSSFQKNQRDAQPILTTHKQNPTRCAHAYLITSCSAKAIIDTIDKYKTNTDTPDFILNFVYPRSPILQSFWLDPPLVYQGNHIVDMEHLETYVGSMYEKKL